MFEVPTKIGPGPMGISKFKGNLQDLLRSCLCAFAAVKGLRVDKSHGGRKDAPAAAANPYCDMLSFLGLKPRL